MVDALKSLSLNTKLDYEKAAYIREEIKKDPSNKKKEELAKEFDVSVYTIKNLMSNDNWTK